ncbi:unnamed protein product [Allacma fusca]|uniref:Uncharacterized protein n=1 Tax=Allacma fusca TaxID=39272 RepID=A0A8J2L829_9HEXA|nr:unnamed protein product [Allacma fusca]
MTWKRKKTKLRKLGSSKKQAVVAKGINLQSNFISADYQGREGYLGRSCSNDFLANRIKRVKVELVLLLAVSPISTTPFHRLCPIFLLVLLALKLGRGQARTFPSYRRFWRIA